MIEVKNIKVDCDKVMVTLEELVTSGFGEGLVKHHEIEIDKAKLKDLICDNIPKKKG